MTVRDVFLTYGKAYLDAFGQRMPVNHKKVIRAIIQCRTPELGTVVCACEDCANTYHIFRSCGSRHCPTCQGEKAINWFNARIDRLMPVHHFMITCTVPAQFRDFFRSHQRFAYSSLFQATSKTMYAPASESTYFSGDTPGFFGVLPPDPNHVGEDKIPRLQIDAKSRSATPGARRGMEEKLECQLPPSRQWRPV